MTEAETKAVRGRPVKGAGGDWEERGWLEPTVSPRGSKKALPKIDYLRGLVKAHDEQGITLTRIAEAYGCTVQNLRKHLKNGGYAWERD